MARTGYYDAGQDLYLPKDTTTWADLTNGWQTYSTWYQTLSASTELEYTSDIIDLGFSHAVFPLITITVRRDGNPAITASYGEEFPEITIEASNSSDMAGAVSVTMTRTSAPVFTGLGSKRYYRVTTTINSGTNTTAQGFHAINIALLTDAIDETIEQFDTSTVDDGSTAIRRIPTRQTYSTITYAGITPRTTITDTVVTGISSDGSTVVFYVATGYVNTGYFVGDVGSSSATVSNITTVPLVRLDSTGINFIDIQLYKPNTALEADAVVDVYVKGLPPTAMDVNGNITRTG